MKFCAISKPAAEEYSKIQDIPDCAIISITDPNGFPAEFAEIPHIKDVLRLEFHDTDRKIDDRDIVITEEDAKNIIDFVERNKDSVYEFIVHCEGGVSRSAGVCAALMKAYNNDDSLIFDNPFYHPNMLC